MENRGLDLLEKLLDGQELHAWNLLAPEEVKKSGCDTRFCHVCLFNDKCAFRRWVIQGSRH